MLLSAKPVAFATSSRRIAPLTKPLPRFVAHQMAGRTEPFNENVAQVKRLISRDRKEFLGNSDDILDKYTTEFGDGSASLPESNPFTSDASIAAPASASAPASMSASTSAPAASSASAASPSSPFSAPATPSDNPFKTTASNPFSSGAAAPKPFKQSIEPRGLTPDMSPDPIIKESPFNLLASIGLTQIVIFISFSLIIGLMVATFFVVVNAGGVRLAGLD